MSEASPIRISLRNGDDVNVDQLALVGRRGLGLSPVEADRLRRALPFSFVLSSTGDESLKIIERLKAAGLGVDSASVNVRFAACPSHPKLAASEVCPKCQTHRACTACLVLDDGAACTKCRTKRRWSARFRNLRVLALLGVLAVVGLGAWAQKRRARSWTAPLVVGVFPIAADTSGDIPDYIARLEHDDFASIEVFFEREGRRYDIPIERPIEVVLGPTLERFPPRPPEEGGSIVDIIVWSLRLRWWAYDVLSELDAPDVDLRAFVIYHPAGPSMVLDNSYGIEQGLITVVHAFASNRATHSNSVVLAHELLHMSGATDKYDPESGQPRFPDGVADPDQRPSFPQTRAEIMGGRIATGPSQAMIPKSLDDCVVGSKTAQEVGWLRSADP